jgi:putative chitinase
MLPNSLTDSIKSKVLEVSSDKLKSDKITPEIAILNIVAKNFLLFPSIARDVNVAKQNMQILVKLAGGRPSKSKPSKSADNDSAEKENKDKKSPTPEKEDGNGLGKIGKKFLDKIKNKIKKSKIGKLFRKLKIGFKKGLRKLKKSFKEISKIIIKFAKKIFTVKNITKTLFNFLKVAGPIGLIISIVGSIGTGFYDAFKEYQESGDIFESIKAGIGGMLEFLTFGLFGKKEMNKLSEVIPELWKDFTKAFFDFKESAIKFVSEKFTMILDFFNPKEKIMPDKGEVPTDKTDQVGDIEKKLKESQDNIQALRFIKSDLENDLRVLENQNDRLDKQISFYESRKTSTSPEPSSPPTSSAPAPVPKQESAKEPAPIVTPEKKTTTEKKPASPGFEAGKSVMIAALDSEGIKDPNARAQIVAQAAHESGKFKFTTELGGDSYFLKYDGRKDLGNTQPGDGPRFKGRGFLQTTGRVNYQQFKDAFNVDVINNPEILGEAKYAAQSALFWFKKNAKKVQNLTKGDWADTKGVTKAVNGGSNGLVEREHYFELFKNDPEITGIGSKIEAKPAPSAAGAQVAQSSSEVSKGQREQLKPTDANVINMDKTNNKTVASNQTTVVDKNKGKSVDTLMARAA